MSLIEKMSILGIRSFGHGDQDKQVIEFFSPLTLILGPNGTGKTTIIECLRYITTGDMPPGSKGGAFVHDPKVANAMRVNGQVRLQFRDTLRKPCIVQRSLEATQKAKKIEMRTLEGLITRIGPDGEKQSITSRCAEIDQEMISSLGVSKSVLDNVIFCHQEDFNWPLSEGKSLKEKFDAIFASTRYVKALETIRKIKIEQDSSAKECKTEIKYLKQNKDGAARLESDLTETQAKYAASKESVEKIKKQISPIEEKLDKIYYKASDINKLNARLGKMQGERDMLAKTMTELEANVENKFVGTDSELRDSLDDFQRLVKKRQDTIKQFEHKKKGLQTKLDTLNNERSSADVDIGKREQEAEANEDNRRRRDVLLRQMANEYDMTGYGTGEITTDRVTSFTRQINKHVATLNEHVTTIKNEYSGKENELQIKIDAVREKKTRLEQNLRNKQETLSRNKCEVREINEKLSKVAASGERKSHLESEIKQLERELKAAETSVNVDQLKTEIDTLQTEKRNLDTSLSALNTEMSRLHMQSSLQTEMNLLKKQKTEKEDTIRRMKARHEDSITQLLGRMPADNIRAHLDDCLIKVSDEVKRGEKELQGLNMNLSKYEANRKMLTEQLKVKEREMKNMEDKIYETCGSEKFDDGLTTLQQKLNSMQDQRGSLLGAEHFFRKYTTDLKKDDPCCPLCHREFDTTQEVRELILELENKLKLVPSRLAQSERDQAELQTKYDMMLQLKPLRENIVRLEEVDLPELKKKISEAVANIDQLKSSIKEKSETLRSQKSDEQTASSIKPDIIMMDRNIGELRDLDKKLTQQSAKLGQAGSGRTLEDVNEEREDAQLTLDTVINQLDHKRDKLRNHNEKVQSLKSHVNELTTDKLRIESDLQQRSQLEESKVILLADVDTLEEEMKEIKEDMLPLQGNIQTLDSDKNQLVKEKEKAVEEAKSKVESVQKKEADVNLYHKKVTSYEAAGKADQLASRKEQRADIQQQLQTIATQSQDLNADLDNLYKELSTQQVRERELEDNLKLREKAVEKERLVEKMQCVRDDIGGLDPVGLEREKNSLENQKDELKTQSMKAVGRQKGYEDEMQRLNKELKSDQYSGATDKHRNKMIALKTTEMASEDLGKYYKVLDRAIMDYHSMKMAEINKIIRDLWRKTYKGNDIDTIEIRSDDDDDGMMKKRRTYNYRVVMIKGDVMMDMRGRCSAGQKVLASLIIRLALAETFCVNCGVLALDEPTTNLDRENIESLANALVEIIKSRSHQRNFRLIVITHDEDFVELLGQSDYVEEYYKIRKNDGGCSEIVRSRVSDLHMH